MRDANRNATGGRKSSARNGIKVVENYGFNGGPTTSQKQPSSGVTQRAAFDVGTEMARENRSMARSRSGYMSTVSTNGDRDTPSPASSGVYLGVSGSQKAPATDTYTRRRG